MEIWRHGASVVLSALFILGIEGNVRAEYRVFELVIEDIPRRPDSVPSPPQQSSPPTASVKTRTVLSTLDPLQYASYYPVGPTEQIRYIHTWRCFGNTSQFKKFCPNPKPDVTLAPDAPPSQPQTPQN